MHIAKQVIFSVAIAAFAPALLAQEATPDTWLDATMSKSRAQVHAEMVAARKDGSIKAVSTTYDFVGRSSTSKSREQVRQELADARASGEFAALNAEAHDFRSLPRTTVYAKAGTNAAE